MSATEGVSTSQSNEIILPPEKDALKNAELLKTKNVLEAEQRALQSTLIQLRNQQRQLMIENSRLKRIWQYREKVKNGEIEDPELRDVLDSGNGRDS
jgi:hypothetical protein|uniref:Uncharacterized protein n=1 Tax=Panagrolaimus sp. PS1159 TaxID=55785 RepID=A0AC35FM83_9BILA